MVDIKLALTKAYRIEEAKLCRLIHCTLKKSCKMLCCSTLTNTCVSNQIGLKVPILKLCCSRALHVARILDNELRICLGLLKSDKLLVRLCAGWVTRHWAWLCMYRVVYTRCAFMQWRPS
mmetsp:Transcript_6965/g.11787  ORF Transcript_6965/g.11787 Transcript_6965/m.11787 type:complete len:120 (+) Transcript_6965:48-407(+)